MKSPKKQTEWDGVKNHQDNNNLKAMKKGDRCFFYHSVKEKTIVGIVEVVKVWEPDKNQPGEPWGYPTVKAVTAVKTPVTLADIKAYGVNSRHILSAAVGAVNLGEILENDARVRSVSALLHQAFFAFSRKLISATSE